MTDAATILALGPLQGQCRLAEGEPVRVVGWARNGGDPGRPVELELLLDGEVLGRFTANGRRRDLVALFPEMPDLGFIVTIPLPLPAEAPRRLALRRAADLAPLAGSPLTLAPGPPPAADFAGRMAGLAALLESRLRCPHPEARAALARELAGALAAALPERVPGRRALLARSGLDAPPPVRRRQALVIDEGVPDPARDAGSAALVSHMQALLRLGYEPGFVPAADLAAGGLAGGGPAVRALTGMGVTVWRLPFVASVEEVLRREGPYLDLVYLHRFGPMRRYAGLVRHWAPQARLVYSVADLHWLRAERRRALLGGAAGSGLRAAELAAVLAADAVITHSSHEAALLARDAPEAAVHLLPWAVAPRPVSTPWAARRGLAFLGSYGHPPNLDAAETLLRQVMPAVWAAAPDVPLLLAGSDLPASLRAEAEAAPGPVEVPGHVPDLGQLWERTRLVLAPLRWGAGLKGKVLDALAAGLPCLCTPIAAEGMDWPAALAPLLCPDPAAMADAVLRLHPDEAACAALGAAGLAWIEDRFSSGRIAEAMLPVVGGQGSEV